MSADQAALHEIASAFLAQMLRADACPLLNRSSAGHCHGGARLLGQALSGAQKGVGMRPLSAARRLRVAAEGEPHLGAHLFTVGITGEMRASRLKLEPDAPARPESYRLGVTMELVLDSLRIKVLTEILLQFVPLSGLVANGKSSSTA
jgi:hypothetical protein